MILERELARYAGDVDRRRMLKSDNVQPAAVASFCKHRRGSLQAMGPGFSPPWADVDRGSIETAGGL